MAKRRLTRAQRIIGWLALSPLLLYAGWFAWESWQLHREFAALRAAGLPMEAADLLPGPVPDEQNAAIPLQQALALMTDLNRASGLTRPVDEFLSAMEFCSSAEDINTWVATDGGKRAGAIITLSRSPFDAIMLLIEQAAARPQCVFPPTVKVGSFAIGPTLGPFRPAVRLLAIRAKLRAADGTMDAALVDLMRILRLDQHLGALPTYDNELLAISGDSICIDALTLILHLPAKAAVRSAEWHRVLDLVTTRRQAACNSMVRALDGERILCGGPLFGNFFAGRDPEGNSEEGGWIFATVLRPVIYVEYRAFLADTAAGRRQVVALASTSYQPPRLPRAGSWLLGNMLGLPMLAAPKACAKHMADLDLARLGLALMLAHEAGGYPPTLDPATLLPDAPRDPFGGAPYHYQRLDHGFRLWSVGPDGKDNGGTRWRTEGRNAEYDLVFQVGE